MPEPVLDVDVAGWVELAREDPVAYRQRQATEITLNAIAMTAPLNEKLYLKGGVLMGLAYDSPRQTSDIDLTSVLAATTGVDEQIRNLLDKAFPIVAAKLRYPDIVVKTNSTKRQPRPTDFEMADFPALKLKIGYAQRGSRQERALIAGQAVNVITVDISFNEPTRAIQILHLTGGGELRAYSLIDLIAEKYRAMLQQVVRNRNRRQDVYDLHLLVEDEDIDAECRAQILDAFLEKCRSRHIEPTRNSLDDPEVKRRSKAEWNTLKLELGELPEFEICFARVREFYRELPWNPK